MRNVFEKHVWLIGINQTSQPFYTSDNPIVRRSTLENEPLFYFGMASPGVEIVYPLSPMFALILVDGIHSDADRDQDCTSVELKENLVELYNDMQVRQSWKLVFCSENRFEFAEQLLKAEPAFQNPDRRRFTFGSSSTATGDSG